MSDAPAGGERRYQRTFPGMIGAMIAVLLLITGVWLLTRVQNRNSIDVTPTVSYSAALSEARSQAHFAVLAPASVPAGWRATSVQWTLGVQASSWHLGFLTSDHQYAGIDQSTRSSAAFVASVTDATNPGGSFTIHGSRWMVTTSPTDTALIRRTGRLTTIVSGTASKTELETLTATLTSS